MLKLKMLCLVMVLLLQGCATFPPVADRSVWETGRVHIERLGKDLVFEYAPAEKERILDTVDDKAWRFVNLNYDIPRIPPTHYGPGFMLSFSLAETNAMESVSLLGEKLYADAVKFRDKGPDKRVPLAVVAEPGTLHTLGEYTVYRQEFFRVRYRFGEDGNSLPRRPLLYHRGKTASVTYYTLLEPNLLLYINGTFFIGGGNRAFIEGRSRYMEDVISTMRLGPSR